MTPLETRQFILNYMTVRGITRYQLSKRTGIKQQHLSNVLDGAGCTEETLHRICDAVGLEVVVRIKGTPE